VWPGHNRNPTWACHKTPRRTLPGIYHVVSVVFKAVVHIAEIIIVVAKVRLIIAIAVVRGQVEVSRCLLTTASFV